MKILIVIGTFPTFSESFIVRKAFALAQRGHQVIVASRDPGITRILDDYLPLPRTLRIVYLTPDSRIRQPIRALRIIKNLVRMLIFHPLATYGLYLFLLRTATVSEHFERVRLFLRYLSFLDIDCDIIHFEFLQLPAMYRLLPRILGKPYVVSTRGSDINLFALRSAKEQNDIISSLRSASAVHAVSEKMVDTLGRILVDREKIWINRPAVHARGMEPIIRESKTDIPQILSIGRLVWIKGLDYLLAAYRILKDRGIKFKARIAGSGNLEHELRFSVVDLDLIDCVEFLGPLPPAKVVSELNQADIFVLSSHTEGVSNSVLEAMAAGLPIVTTDAGGMREAVRDGIDGFVVPVRNPNALANRIEQLVRDPALRKQLGGAARDRVVSEFDLSKQAQIFERMYLYALHVSSSSPSSSEITE